MQDQANEVRELQQELEQSRAEGRQMQESLNDALGALKTQLISSNSNLESAALAGLGLTEMVNQLRADRDQAVDAMRVEKEKQMAQQKRDLEAAMENAKKEMQALVDGKEAELAALRIEFNENAKLLSDREALLTQIMVHLQGEQTATKDGDEGKKAKAGAFDAEDFQARMERVQAERRSLEDQLADFEQENGRLERELAEARGQRSELLNNVRKLEKSVADKDADLESVQAALAARNEMLAGVMRFLKEQGLDLNGGGSGKRGDGDGDNDDEASLKNLASSSGADLSRAISEQMAAAAAEHQRLLEAARKSEQDIKQLTQRVRELEQAVTDGQDELASRNQQLSAAEQLQDQLQHAQEDAAMWKAKFDEELALRNKVQGELDTLRAELAGANADMEAAARAGLTLTEMLAQLKADYVAKIKALEEENASLRNDVAQYKKGEFISCLYV